MPHVVLKGNIPFIDAERLSFPLYERNDWLIKVEEFYVERHHKKALLPVVVVEEGHSQKFYIKLSLNEQNHQITVRLDPSTDPVKTRGVKRSVALVAESILSRFEDALVERHNLHDYLNCSTDITLAAHG